VLEIDTVVAAVQSGDTTIEEIVVAGLTAAGDDRYGAWVALDPSARAHACEADAQPHKGKLAGITVGVKDLFGIAGLPMRAGSRITSASPSDTDAAVVRRLRDLGASILGTTSMPEFAYGPTPGARNPLDPTRTPGSSSAGSAIAVAAGHVAVGLATQTNGSIVRPAAYCGVAGLKPSHGSMSLDGMPRLVPTLDQPGFIAASAASLQTLWSAWTGEEPGPAADSPRVALVRTSRWQHADEASRAAVETVARDLDAAELVVPDRFDEAWAWMETIIAVELAHNLAPYDGRPDLTHPIQEAIDTGRATTPERYVAALAGRRDLQAWAADALADIDAVVTPATTGHAPLLEDGAGSPEFCTLWSLAGLPALTVPAPRRRGELPIGIQLVGAPGRDRSLLALAASLESQWRAVPSNQESR